MGSVDPTGSNSDLFNFGLISETGDISFNTYLSTIFSSKEGFKNLLEAFEILDATQQSQLTSALIASTAARIAVRDRILAAVAQWRDLSNRQILQTSTIAAFNTTNRPIVNDKITNLNAAIAAYNADPSAAKKDELNAAIAAYNNTVVPIVNEYNTAANTYDAKIGTLGALNTELQALGIPKLPTPQSLAPRITPSVPTHIADAPPAPATVSSVSNLSSLATPLIPAAPTDSEALQQYLVKAFKIFQLDFVSIFSQFVNIDTSVSATDDAERNPIDITLPIGSTQQTRVFFDSTDGIALGSVSSLSITSGLSYPLLSRVLSRASYNAILIDGSQPLTMQQIDELQMFSLGLLTTGGQLAGIETARLLQNFPVSPEGEPQLLDFLSPIAFSTVIHNIVSSEQLRASVLQVLRTSPAFASLTDAQREALVDPLTAIVRASLTQVSVAFASSSIGLPGLTPQVLANVPGASLASGRAPSFNDVLLSPNQVLAVKLSFSDLILLRIELSKSEADSLASRAINRAIAETDFKKEEDLQDAIERSLIADGIRKETARELAIEVVKQIKEEATLAFLDRSFRQDNLVAFRAKNPTVPPTVSSALDELEGRTFVSNRDFRDSLEAALTARNVEDAHAVANQIVTQIQPTQIATSPLQNVNPYKPLSPAELSDTLSTSTVTQLSPYLGEARAREVAGNLTHVVVGTPISDLTDQRNILRDQAQEGAARAFNTGYRAAITPSIPLYTLTNTIGETIKDSPEVVSVYMQPKTAGDMRTQSIGRDFRRDDISIRI